MHWMEAHMPGFEPYIIIVRLIDYHCQGRN